MWGCGARESSAGGFDLAGDEGGGGEALGGVGQGGGQGGDGGGGAPENSTTRGALVPCFGLL